MNDFILIGAGPVGLYGAYLAGLRGLKGCVLESLPIVGGQLTTLYPEKTIYDLPGFVDVKASTFIDHLYHQYQRFQDSIPIHLHTSVVSIHPQEDGTFHVETSTKEIYKTKFVILTSGIGLMTPKRLEDTFAPHPLIQYGLDDLSSYKDQNIVILGGGNTALDYGNTLLPFAKSVTLVHRREVFKAFEASLALFTQQGGQWLVPYQLEAYTSLYSGLNLTFYSESLNQKQTLQAHRLIVCYGYGTNLSTIFHDLLKIAPKKHEFEQNKISVNAQYQTSLEGVYAAGDAISYEGKANHLSQGFGEVTTIMEVLHSTLYPTKKIPHSSFMTFKKD